MPEGNLTVTITILGKSFQVACPADEVDALHEAAQDLNERMLSIRSSGRVFGLERIAVMAALNITHDHLELKKNHELMSRMLTTKSAELVAKIDRAIATDDASPADTEGVDEPAAPSD